MTDSAMVIMWPNRDGSVTLSQRAAAGHVQPTVVQNPPRVATKYLELSSVRRVVLHNQHLLSLCYISKQTTRPTWPLQFHQTVRHYRN
jgi:hypothetical protein